jgi:hypothetical protein
MRVESGLRSVSIRGVAACVYPPYFYDTRLEGGICQRREVVKGAWLLGFVLVRASGGLDMRFLGGKWQKKNKEKADSLRE